MNSYEMQSQSLEKYMLGDVYLLEQDRAYSLTRFDHFLLNRVSTLRHQNL